MAKLISIISLKSNTGNTTVALNLGLALHKLGNKVVVIDADFSRSNIIDHLNILNPMHTLNSVVNNESYIFDSIIAHDSGLKVVPSIISNSVDNQKVGFYLNLLSPHNDFVIIDMPKEHELIDILLKYVDEAFIVHSPEYSSKMIVDASNLLSKNKVINLGVILNKSPEESVDSFFSNPVIEKIPQHRKIIKSFQKKQPLTYLYPKSDISKKFFRIANRITH
ncbi:MAG: site-determining protein [Candidatus Woesearchaeota archaeon]|nr:MAG: site-determining protein [Candidatus Woesearchaeota archaeon]